MCSNARSAGARLSWVECVRAVDHRTGHHRAVLGAVNALRCAAPARARGLRALTTPPRGSDVATADGRPGASTHMPANRLERAEALDQLSRAVQHIGRGVPDSKWFQDQRAAI